MRDHKKCFNVAIIRCVVRHGHARLIVGKARANGRARPTGRYRRYLSTMNPPASSAMNTIVRTLKYLSMNDLMGGPKA